MYHYWGFGLAIKSEIEFPELLPFDFEEEDLKICIGKTPERLYGDEVVEKVRVSISPAEYLLKVMNIAHYYVANGNEIVIDPLPGADEKSIRLFLLSNAIAAILHQRNMIPFHASAVCCGDGIALICGPSGAGKSTTATALQQKGYKIFSDDVCVLKYSGDERQMLALPSYPMIKLWKDSFAKTGLAMAEEQDKIRPKLEKYARWYHSEFSIDPKPIKHIFILAPSREATELKIKKITSFESFMELQKNTYRSGQTFTMKKRDIHFAAISRLTNAAPAIQIIRPLYHNSLKELPLTYNLP